MDNTDYFESVGAGEEYPDSGRCRVELLHRQTCTRFQPYREYFSTMPISQVLPSRPTFTPTISRSIRDYLKPQRQIKYLKGILQYDYCQQTMEELLGEQQHHPIKKLKNISVILGDMLYWAEVTVIKAVKVWDFIGKEKLQPNKEIWNVGIASPKVVVDVKEWIYEMSVEDGHIYVRTPRGIFVLSPQTGKLVSKIVMEEQLINYHYRGGEGTKLLLSTYQNRFSQLYSHINGEQQLWCKLDGLVNSIWAKTQNEVMVCKENAILVVDRRKKVVNQLQRRPHAHQNRIYAGISLGETVYGERYFATTQSFQVCIYDMRKPYEPILKMPHYCQQSPPSILQTWSSASTSFPAQLTLDNFQSFLSSSKQWQQQNPLLIAHSPYQTGSSLFTELTIDWQTPHQLIKKQFNAQNNQFSNRFQLLYDAGKMQEHYHPRSITPFKMESCVGFFHLDNFNGISLQILERGPSNYNLKNYKKTNQNNYLYHRVNFIMQEGVEELQNANQEWFNNNLIEKHLQSEKTDVRQIDRNEERQGQKDDDDDSLELQEHPFEQKVVRFADLRQFYHKVHEQAKQFSIKQKIKEEENAVKKGKPIENRSFPIQATQTQTQRTDETIKLGLKVGHLTQQAISQLLQQWSSL